MPKRDTPPKKTGAAAWIVAICLGVLLSSCDSDTPEAEPEPTTLATEELPGPSEESTSADEATEDALLGGAVVFSVHDKYTLYDDGPGTVILAGVVQVGVLRPGDGLEILNRGSETATTILRITVGAPSVEVDSLSAGEFGDILVSGDLAQFEFDSQLVRPTS